MYSATKEPALTACSATRPQPLSPMCCSLHDMQLKFTQKCMVHLAHRLHILLQAAPEVQYEACMCLLCLDAVALLNLLILTLLPARTVLRMTLMICMPILAVISTT